MSLRALTFGTLWLSGGCFEAYVPEGAICGEVSASGKIGELACVVLRGTAAEVHRARVRTLAAVSTAVRGG